MNTRNFVRLVEETLHVRMSETIRSVGGGSINEAFAVQTNNGPIFVKRGDPSAHAMFEAEAEGLRQLADANAVRVPRVLATGANEKHAFIALEWIDCASASGHTDRLLGERLARLHAVTASDFGWHRDNTIGLMPQRNTPSRNWIEFWQTHRLGFQLELARQNGAPKRVLDKGERLLNRVDSLLAGHQPRAALIHGDLWSGNRAADAAGEPVIFDPAVYFGDREVELAMMKLFGGFHAECYGAYEAAAPLPPGHEQRLPLYQLYHVLNHFNLFGGSYAGQAEQLMDRLLRLG